jgi:methylmalonyl-CoA/ethylmalonyl-CoA epimerase
LPIFDCRSSNHECRDFTRRADCDQRVRSRPREAFYRDKLSLSLLFTAGKLAFFDCGAVRLMLDIAEKPELDHPSSILYFTVADIAAAHREMLASGVCFEDQPRMITRMPNHDLWMTFFPDSEQNLLWLMSEVQRTA